MNRNVTKAMLEYEPVNERITRKNCLPLMRPSVQQPISKDKNVMTRARKYYLKNNYLTLRSKVKAPQRSLRYVTHRLMIMHPHTK
jgi:hypothetical protein